MVTVARTALCVKLDNGQRTADTAIYLPTHLPPPKSDHFKPSTLLFCLRQKSIRDGKNIFKKISKKINYETHCLGKALQTRILFLPRPDIKLKELMAFFASSSELNRTKPNPLLTPFCSVTTLALLQEEREVAKNLNRVLSFTCQYGVYRKQKLLGNNFSDLSYLN